MPRVLDVRDAVCSQLPLACRAEVSALLSACYPMWARQLGKAEEWAREHGGAQALKLLNTRGLGQVRLPVAQWATRHRLSVAWLQDRLTEAVHRTWDGELEARDVRDASVERFAAALAEPRRLDSEDERTARGDARIRLRLSSVWLAFGAGDSPREDLRADPTRETQEQFLGRAAVHYQAWRQACEAMKLPVHRARPETERHAGWLLRHRVKRHSYRKIAEADGVMAGAVEKAVRRLAAVAELDPTPAVRAPAGR